MVLFRLYILSNTCLINFSISRIFYFTALFSMLDKYISILLQVKKISVATLLSNAPTKLYTIFINTLVTL